jgi:hypothetical protein
MGIDPTEQGLVEHYETIDISGDVKLWLRDLEDTWKKENAHARRGTSGRGLCDLEF